MYMGVVANPIPEKEFDGKIFLKRVSKFVKYKQMSHNQNFTHDASANGLLKDGDWLDETAGLVVNGMTLGDLKEVIAEVYALEDDIRDRLVLRYKVGSEKKKNKYIVDDDEILTDVELMRMDGYTLMVRSEKGDEREVDITCESDFMKKVMPEVGEAIREAYHWVEKDTPIFLYLDNAGGHGTDETVDEYVGMLAEKHNVICVHQRPRSPATNMLDLGVWMAVQHVVESLHFHRRKEIKALAETVEEAWHSFEPIKLENVYKRWKKVLSLIIEDEGGDRLVESKRGKLFSAPTVDAECFLDDIVDFDCEYNEEEEEW